MDIFFYHAKHGNFGDDLNDWIWQKLWPDLPLGRDDGLLLVGIGTILGIPLPPGSWQKHVVGSGMGYGEIPALDGSWHVHAVRGPVTARILDLNPNAVAGDGALLLRKLPEFAEPAVERSGVVFMPHLSVVDYSKWPEVCRRAGVTYLDPRSDSQATLQTINSAKLVLADAMHAAIVADTLRVPWRPLITTAAISTLKWMDWSLAVGAEYRPTKLRFSCLSEWLMHWATKLSGRSHQLTMPMDATQEQLTEALADEYRHHKQKQMTSWSRLVAPPRALLWRAAQRPMRWLRDSAIAEAVDERLIDRAAAQLRQLASEPGHLSPTQKLDEATDKLWVALQSVRETSNFKNS